MEKLASAEMSDAVNSDHHSSAKHFFISKPPNPAYQYQLGQGCCSSYPEGWAWQYCGTHVESKEWKDADVDCACRSFEQSKQIRSAADMWEQLRSMELVEKQLRTPKEWTDKPGTVWAEVALLSKYIWLFFPSHSRARLCNFWAQNSLAATL